MVPEKVGNILLDYEFYPGEDLYSDGPVEDEMLEVAKNFREEEYNQVIARRKSWPLLYHFSHIRQNIVNWYPLGARFWRSVPAAVRSPALWLTRLGRWSAWTCPESVV